jgi:hypothetical protein
LFLRSIRFPLHPCGLYLLTTHDKAYRSAKRGADQSRCRSQPRVGGHTNKITATPKIS